jgi:hypothetical protein
MAKDTWICDMTHNTLMSNYGKNHKFTKILQKWMNPQNHGKFCTTTVHDTFVK